MNLKLQFSLPLSLALCLVPNFLQIDSVAAQQITSDGTTGTTVTNDGNNFTIQDGTRNGGNLFHSFQDFSVPTGGSAFFNNGNGISNILSRVTGGNFSNIDGLIRANGSANLFLINPAGIIFGEGASLNIGGSFYGSTADSILFDDGEFSAVNNLDAPILTINAPIGLNFRDNPSEIVTNGTKNAIDIVDFSLLAVAEDQSLNLIGGNIDLNNTILFAPGGNIELGGLQASGSVSINENGGLSFPENIARGNISLDNSQVFANFSNDGEGGSINLNANNIELVNASFLQTGINAESGFVGAQAGDINLNATGMINISGGSIFNQVFTGGIGDAGNINVNATSLAFSQVQLSSNTFGQGNAGNILIDVNETAELINGDISSQVGIDQEGNPGIGDGGTITVNTTNLSLLDGSQITAGVFGEGNAGNVTVNADDTITFQGIGSDGFPSGILNNVASGGVGNAGNIEVTTANLNLIDGAAITSNAEGQGNAGDITVDANKVSLLDDATLSSSTFGVGNAGGVEITTANLNLTNGSTVAASTFAEGNAGTVIINASDTISVDGEDQEGFNSGIGSIVSSGAVGNAGGIEITTANLNLTNGGNVSASTFGEGNAGTVTIDATENISVDGVDQEGSSTAISSRVNAGAVGNAGGVEITTTNLNLTNGGTVSATTFATGDAGTVRINATDTISIDGEDQEGSNSSIGSNVNSGAIGDAGGVEITTANLNLTNGGTVAASTFAEGNAGTVTINATDTISIDGEDPSNDEAVGGIFSNVQGEAVGNAGGVEITTTNLNLTNGGTVAASTFAEGNAGTVTINATDTISIDGEDQEGFNSFIASNVQGEAVGNAGGIEITTANLNLTNGGNVSASTFGQGNAGTVSIDATDTISIDSVDQEGSSTAISSRVNAGAVGNAGGVEITTKNLNLTNGGTVSATTFATGDAGTVRINATDTISIDGEDPNDNLSNGGIFSNVQGAAIGDAGGVEITTANLNLTNGGIVAASTFAQGNAGTLTIDASDTISINGLDQEGVESSIESNVNANSIGDAGGVNITTNNLSLSNGGTVSASTFGEGNAGTINIDASDTIFIDGEDPNDNLSNGGIFSNVQGAAIGDAGGVEINTANLNLTNGGIVAASTFAQGNAGTVTINASDTISIDGLDQEGFESSIESNVNTNAIGDAGGVNISTNNLSLSNGGTVSASTAGQGNAGDILINATELVNISGEGSAIVASTSSDSTGNGGNITIGRFELDGEILVLDENLFIKEINLSDGGQITAESLGEGNGGSIKVLAEDLTLNNQGQILAETNFPQPEEIAPSKITLSIADNLVLRENSTISAQAFNNANGGDISINAADGFVVAFPNKNEGDGSDISASSGATGGNITIEAQSVLGIEERKAIPGNSSNDIDASGDVKDGSVEITTATTDAIQGVNQLPSIPVEPGETVVQACSGQRGIANSNFVIKGKGGVPNPPDAILSSEIIRINGEAINSQSPHQEDIQPISTSKGEIILARGVEITEDGGIILTAYETDNSSRNPQQSVNCN